ncbi:MAG TPA: thioredoxin family protein [Rhizomicrobium sp.]
MRFSGLILAGSAVLALTAPLNAATAPQISISALSQLRTPLPFSYDGNANADKVVDAALARQEHKRVFIDLGGNWCGDCRVLAGLMDLPEVKAFVAKHYVVALVDVGRFNKNLQIPARWNMVQALKEGGAPTILIVDPTTNKVVDEGHTGALEDARHMGPQAIVDYIAQWTK